MCAISLTTLQYIKCMYLLCLTAANLLAFPNCWLLMIFPLQVYAQNSSFHVFSCRLCMHVWIFFTFHLRRISRRGRLTVHCMFVTACVRECALMHFSSCGYCYRRECCCVRVRPVGQEYVKRFCSSVPFILSSMIIREVIGSTKAW